MVAGVEGVLVIHRDSVPGTASGLTVRCESTGCAVMRWPTQGVASGDVGHSSRWTGTGPPAIPVLRHLSHPRQGRRDEMDCDGNRMCEGNRTGQCRQRTGGVGGRRDMRAHAAASGAQPPVIDALVTPGDIGRCANVEPRCPKRPLFAPQRRLTGNDIMQSCVGEPAPVLVSRWGASTTTYDHRNGSRILTWRDQWSGCAQTALIDPQDILSRWRYAACGCLQRGEGPSEDTPIPPMTP